MFNLIMQGIGWEPGRGTSTLGRLFEYTEDDVIERFREAGEPALARLAELPCLFMQEGRNEQVARAGSIVRPRVVGREITFEVLFDPEVPPIPNEKIYEHRADFDIPHEFEFSRTHWAVKDIDLFRSIYRLVRPRRQRPTLFALEEHERIEPELMSVMMPFDAALAPVYESIQQAAAMVNLRCRRADDIWEAPAIIQDIVSLIDRSRVVVCDCTGRNPNVFYEIGIAHTLGREVVLLTQNEADVPFDLRHLRHIRYLNNVEGRGAMAVALAARLGTIVGR